MSYQMGGYAEFPQSFYDETDDMCPNCQTPWKCNGPHLSDQTPAAAMDEAREERARDLGRRLFPEVLDKS